jgi:hypothetical protein
MHLVAGGGDPSEDAQVEFGLDWEHGVLDGALGLHGRAGPGIDASEDRVLLGGGWRWVWAGHAVSFVQLADLPSGDYPAANSSCQMSI